MTCVSRKWTILAAAGILLATVTTTARAHDAGPIRLGLIDIYSGGVAFIAESIRTGFEIALQEANDAGGVNGRMFELTTADMGGSVEKAVTEARRMILEQDIRYVTVGIHSGAAVAVGSLAKEHKALVVGGFATSKRLTGSEGHRFVARANLSTVEIGRVMAEFIKDRPDIKSVATDRAGLRIWASTSPPISLRISRPCDPMSRLFARNGQSSEQPTSRRTLPPCRLDRQTWWSPAFSVVT